MDRILNVLALVGVGINALINVIHAIKIGKISSGD